ncbi:MAG: CpsD/CapB family tyrosine-protein kinase [Atopobiaceae bacterium]|jgi:capsular exopolysaccharide synthesis family protein|nr:CpsD/CapB family tyrosine-protein kinase [Olsenella sp.]MDY3900555.1 CpsD/CapB family tyrosine-protein kinase [Atopobiaceae bacterium]
MPGKRTADRQAFQNAVKTLAANIRFASVDNPVRTICVTSSIPSEGKTTTSVALGRAFAEGGAQVLLLECDMRRRSLATAIGRHGRYGLYSVLTGERSVQEAAVAVGQPKGLYFLDSEPGIPNPPDVLQSKRFHALLAQLQGQFDYVIVDTPPVATFVDAAVVASFIDATVLVVRQDFTHREDVRAAYDQLVQAGANVVGTVLNCCDATSSGHYYGYYKERRHDSYDIVAPGGEAGHPSSGVESPVSMRAGAAQAGVHAPISPSVPASVPRQTGAPAQQVQPIVPPRRVVYADRSRRQAAAAQQASVSSQVEEPAAGPVGSAGAAWTRSADEPSTVPAQQAPADADATARPRPGLDETSAFLRSTGYEPRSE